MNQDQVNSLIRTVLKIAGSVLMTHGLTQYATLVNSPDVCGLAVLLVGLWLSHQTHGAAVTATQMAANTSLPLRSGGLASAAISVPVCNLVTAPASNPPAQSVKSALVTAPADQSPIANPKS